MCATGHLAGLHGRRPEGPEFLRAVRRGLASDRRHRESQPTFGDAIKETELVIGQEETTVNLFS